MLFLYVVSWLVIQLEETQALRASLKSTLHHDLQLSVTWWDKSGMFSWRLCDSTDKTLSRGTGWSLLSLTSSWALPSPVTCDKTAACRRKEKKNLSSSATQTLYASLTFSPFESPKDSLRRKVGWPRFNDLSTLSKIAFNLTLMASDKCPGWLQERSVLIRRLPVVSHLVCSLFYKCHCHILLNICLSFLGW